MVEYESEHEYVRRFVAEHFTASLWDKPSGGKPRSQFVGAESMLAAKRVTQIATENVSK